MRTISLGIPDIILDEIDKLVKENNVYGNRSDVLRQAIEELLSEELDYYKEKNRWLLIFTSVRTSYIRAFFVSDAFICFCFEKDFSSIFW